MNPDLEFFLEKALGGIPSTSPEIGRVVVEPDYEVTPEEKDAGHLASELLQALRAARINKRTLARHEGQEIDIPAPYRLLRKYLRRITLHAEGVEGEWIEVAPPGNWI